jgi:hypothetical protein
MMSTTGRPVQASVAALEQAQRDATERTIAEWTRRYTRTESRDNEHKYAKAASAYVERLGERRPIQALAEHLIVSVPHARNLIYEARKRGLLTEAQPGRAGGTLTPKAMDLLEQGD